MCGGAGFELPPAAAAVRCKSFSAVAGSTGFRLPRVGWGRPGYLRRLEVQPLASAYESALIGPFAADPLTTPSHTIRSAIMPAGARAISELAGVTADAWVALAV